MEGINVVGIQFRRAGRIYDFATGDLDLRVGDDVVVDTDRGPSLAKVAKIAFSDVTIFKEKPLKNILRLATEKDKEEARKLTPEYATSFAREKVDSLKLKMTVLQAEVQFGGNKVIIYFSAPGRVDFRDLVKELAGGLKSRVELKQVGARDEAKLVGGIGICGREFCCSSFLREFVPVSIKMAKNQNLALNPSKVSGGCGRLLCCLTYENDVYTELRSLLPPKGTMIRVTGDEHYGSVGKVIRSDALNQEVLFEGEDGRYQSVKMAHVEILDSKAKSTADSDADEWAEDLDLDALTNLDDKSESKETKGSNPDSSQDSQARPQRDGDQNRGQGNKGRRSRGKRNRNPRGGKGKPGGNRSGGDQ